MEKPTRPPGGDKNLGPAVLAVAWVTTSIALIFFVLRIYARAFIVRRIWWDDYSLALSVVLALIGICLNIPEVLAGFGRHTFYLTASQMVRANKFNFLAMPFLIMSNCFAKISICLALSQITTKKPGKVGLYSLIVTLFVINSVTFIIILAQCKPIAGLWNHAVKAKCLNPQYQEWSAIAQGIFSIITDCFLGISPIFIIWKLKMQTRSKVVLCCLMGMAFLAAAAGIVRTIKSRSIALRSDFTWAGVDLAIWSLVEQNIAIVAASVPPLRSFFIKGFRARNDTTAGYPTRGYTHKGYVISGRGADSVNRTQKSHTEEEFTLYNVDPRSKDYKTYTSEQASNTTRRGSDEDSDKGILPQSGIQRKTDIRVEYGNVV